MLQFAVNCCNNKGPGFLPALSSALPVLLVVPCWATVMSVSGLILYCKCTANCNTFAYLFAIRYAAFTFIAFFTPSPVSTVRLTFWS
jgi:hypothetical protein